jgi:hypothetical protein
MATLDSLPADQRAVLQLVLQRGRSYDEIARLLSIDRTAVRQRALSAFDALGPQTGISDQRRHLITDYLLNQLPGGVAGQVRDRLAQSASERAWARVLASELAPLSATALPEIPTDGGSVAERDLEAAPPPYESPIAAPPEEPVAESVPAPEPEKAKKPKKQRESILLRSFRRDRTPRESRPAAPSPAPEPLVPESEPKQSSRLGGALLIVLGAIVVIVVVVLLLGSGSSPKHHSTVASHSGTTSTSGSATSGTSSAAKVIAQINLTPPSSGSKAAGIAEILKEGTSDGIAIVAQNVPANTTKPANAYAVWLYNSPTDAHILGFVNPGVGSNGRLSTAGGLPTNAAHYKQLIVTVETSAHPTTPGTIILQGNLTGL